MGDAREVAGLRPVGAVQQAAEHLGAVEDAVVTEEALQQVEDHCAPEQVEHWRLWRDVRIGAPRLHYEY